MNNVKFYLKVCSFILLILPSLIVNAFDSFTPLDEFGDNPGELSASTYLSLKSPAALVVLLHGCTQNGEQLAQQSGLLSLAKAKKFNLLIPQQSLNNNPKTCFNWYSPQDTQPDQGELLSLKNMMLTMQAQTQITDVFIMGVSAGGAMTSALIVNYPDMFDAAAVIAGISFPCATDLIQAISCMKNGPSESPNILAMKATQLHKNREPNQHTSWPKLSLWTGDNDTIVNSKNATSLAEQWAILSGITSKPNVIKENGYQVSQWQNRIELYEINNLGHGIPVNPTIESGGEIAPFLLAAPVSAMVNIINFWGLQNKDKPTSK